MIQPCKEMNNSIANPDITRLNAIFTGENVFLPKGTTSNPRQRRKIIGSFRNPDIIKQKDVSISKRKVKSFLKKIARIELTDKKSLEKNFQSLISKIGGNLLKMKLFPMFEKIKTDKRLTGILAYFTRNSLYRRDQIRANDILVFLQKFPNPYIFQYEAKDFLDIIEWFNCRNKRIQYEASMKTFMEVVYGKKFEYLMEINLLRREAKQIYLKNLNNCKKEMDSLLVKTVNKSEAEKVLHRTLVQGSPFKGQRLTPGVLEKWGLLPKYQIYINGIERAFFSPAYNIGQGRIAVTAYIKKEKKYIAVSYYLSNSHGIWRCLDGYFMVENKIISYGKKGRQDSMNLSLVFQKALSNITQTKIPIIDICQGHSDFVFAGTTYNALFQINANPKVKIEQKNGLTLLNVPDLPQKLAGNFYPEKGKRIPPEAIKFYNQNQAPDFSKLITQWEAKNKTYGNINYEAFLSKNGQFIYAFCRDEKNRIWLGSIENHSNIKPSGIREIWVDGGDLTTPAYEYDIKAGNYGNRKLRRGNYIDMYENYLSKIWKTVS